MKRFFRIFLTCLLAIILLSSGYVLINFPPVVRGIAARTMCSCVFVSGRSPESVKQKELRVFPGLPRVPMEVNVSDSTVTASLLFQKSKAIYRRGLGCTLLAEEEESEVRKQRFNTYNTIYPDQDTIPWPTGDLDRYTSAPNIDREGIDKVVNEAFEDKDRENPVNTHAVVAVYKGKIISEKYADGFGPESVIRGWSITKSLTNALIGILVKKGKLDLQAPAPVGSWSNDERKNITLNHLLQASSGLAWSESYFRPDADFHKMFILSDDMAGYAASRKLQDTPGEVFKYSSGTTNIVSKIIRQTVGDENYHRFPHEHLFSKIGMHRAIIEVDPSGTFVASSFGYASARDWARLGLLYLNDGVWNGERILPEGWVKYSLTPAPAAPRREYGAHIWLNFGQDGNPTNVEYPGLPREAIVFDGFEKNFVVIIPSRELVVVRLGVTHNSNFSIAKLVTGIVNLLPENDNLVASGESAIVNRE